MVLVVDRKTRRVIDCTQLNYSWDLDNLVERHDFTKVELIVRQWSSTKPAKIEEEAEQPDEPVMLENLEEEQPL